MPLKHSTETAYLVLLGLVIAAAGFAAALLPPYPEGMPYWAVLLALSCFYPVALSWTFRNNRADYEFRVLHWFPAGIFVLWLILELTAPLLSFLNILKLGFFFLWSLPLVALGVAFIIIFALHVLRRSRIRVTLLSILLVLFTVGALAAEAKGVNSKIQAAIFPKTVPTIASASKAYDKLMAYINSLSSGTSSSRPPVAIAGSSSSAQSSVMAFVSSVSSAHSLRSSLPPIAQDKNPGKLPNSGPESVALIVTTLMGLYGATVHARAKKRV